VRHIVEKSDWPATLRQTLPRLGRVLRALRPTWLLSSLSDVSPSFLEQHGLRGLVWDVDGTLTHHHAPEMEPAARHAFDQLRSVPGTRHVIASNCGERRFLQLGTLFPDVPVLKLYTADGGVVNRRLLGEQDTWTGPAQGRLVSLRKPDERIGQAALRELGLAPSEVAVVGDQHITDIALANLSGLRSIKVPTIGKESFPAPVRLAQKLEEWLFRFTA
jgi:hypothetical protein